MRLVSILLVAILLTSVAPLSFGYQNGLHSNSSGCGCHYGGSATVSMSGHPSSYTASQTYTLSISVSNGVSGSAGGFNLEVNKGTLSTGGVGIMAVKVNQNGDSATHTTSSYRSWSVDWTAPSSGSGTAQFTLAGLTANGNGQNSGDAYGTATYQVPEGGGPPPNNPPSASNLQLSPTNPVTTDILTLTYTFQDSDGDQESGSEIRWYKDGVLVPSRNDMMTVPPSLTSKGESWNVTVTPSDGTDNGAPVHSTNLQVVNSIPVVTSAQITPNDAVESDDLTVSWSSNDDDGDTRTVSGIEWYVDGSKVSVFDNDTTIPSIAIRNGDVWYAKVKVNDGEADSVWFSTANVTIGSDVPPNNPPTMTSVSINPGPYMTMDDLQASASGNDADGDALTYEWDWPGTNGAVSSSTLPSFYTEKGESWTVRCRVTDGELYSDWLESSSVIIQNTAPQLDSVQIDQDTVYFQNEATYSFTASDADEDQLTPTASWSVDGNILTLTLSVHDDDMAHSNTLTDTVEIVNSHPVAIYNGEVQFDALSDLSPTFESSDANGDQVTLSVVWLRNGFSTAFNSSSIPASNLAPGDTWTAMVTPNDGIDNGEALMVDFTITNTGPTALITAPDSMTAGSMVTFSAMDSSDADGAVVSAMWYVGGELVHTGMMYERVMSTSLTLEVTVFDEQGASDSAMDTYSASQPPEASNLKAKAEGTDVRLTWTGSAQEWAIFVDGEFVDTAEKNEYLHTPIMEGTYNYQVSPVIDGEVLDWKNPESTTSLQMDASSVEDTPGPSQTLGLVFGIVLLLLGLTGVAISFIPRRD